jgi:hypothetical protein
MSNIPMGDDYFIALGKFIHAFSEAERGVHFTFHSFARIDPSIANIIKRESASGVIASLIRALIVRTNFSDEDVADVHDCLDQFNVVSEFRHSTIHRGAKREEDGSYISTNHATLKSLEHLEVSFFTIKDLDNARMDLGCITLRLFDCADETRPPRKAHESAYLHAPWRYKSASPDKPLRPTRTEKTESKRQRKASQKLASGRTRPPPP